MELIDFYKMCLLSVGLEIDDSGVVMVDDEPLTIDDKPVVLPTNEHIKYLKKTKKADRYLFNPLSGNNDNTREDYEVLLKLLNVNLFVGVKDLMIKLTDKFKDDNTDGIATVSIFRELHKAKGNAKILIDDSVVGDIKDLTPDNQIISSVILPNGKNKYGRHKAILNIFSNRLEDLEKGKEFYKEKKRNRYQKELLTVITDPLLKGKDLVVSDVDYAEFDVLVKAIVYVYEQLTELAKEISVDIEIPINVMELDKVDLESLYEVAIKLPNVVGDEVIINKSASKVKLPTIDDYDEDDDDWEEQPKRSKKSKSKSTKYEDELLELREKSILTLSESKRLKELERLVYEREDDYYDDYPRRTSRRRRTSRGRSGRGERGRSRSRGYRDDRYRGRSSRRARSVDDLYEDARRGRTLDRDDEYYDDDLPWYD